MKYNMPKDWKGSVDDLIKIINSGRVLLWADVQCPICGKWQSYASCNGCFAMRASLAGDVSDAKNDKW